MSFQYIPDFHRIILQDKKLRVPKKYVEKYWKGISNPIFLKLPNGVQQKIFWVENNGDIWFQKNWDNFAKSLKYGNLLTFKYIGGSYFKVKIFGVNALEIDYSNIKSVDEVVEATKEDKEIVDLTDESEIPKEAQMMTNGKRKMSIDIDTLKQKFPGRNIEDTVKKVKKSSRIEVVNETTNNVNPFFEVLMTQTYAHGHILVIPCNFSRSYLNKFEGIASLRVGEDTAMKVDIVFNNKRSSKSMSTGWKLFNQKYNLQVGDKCKFVMTQREPLLFTITITKAIKGPNPKKLQGYKEGISSVDRDFLKRKDTEETCRTLPKVHALQGYKEGISSGDRDILKRNGTGETYRTLPKVHALQGYKEWTSSCDKNILQRKDIGETSSWSCPKEHASHGIIF
ncbi:putative transcription factor B3-Domain family [Medicago truncatula]|uniref:Putative transcription factor B3-Domain family n=1 Tax=Medicago truncatula TaxID=3880 RepID=A0A396JJ07_MEDTR|nr:putative transcription factor B3-Domain family [Medicago truncatula]